MMQLLRFLSLTLACLAVLFAPAVATAQPGVWQTEEQFLNEAGPGWHSIAPGVWQKEKADGHVVRVGFGIESFEWALGQTRDRLEGLTAKSAAGENGRQLERRITETRQVITFLERTLTEAASAPGTLAPKASQSGSVCAGYYDLEVTFTCGSTSAQTSSTASWSEPGPLSPYDQYLHTYAEASWYDKEFGITRTHTDEDSFGPVDTCCGSSSSTAYALQTSSADLYGEAYLTVNNGCSAYRFVQDSDDCI